MTRRKPTINDLLGAHVSAAGGVFNAPGRAAALPARAMAIFTKNQNQWEGKSLAAADVEKWFAELATHGLQARHVCAHDAYLINLASPDKTIWNKSIEAFVDELHRCKKLGIRWLITHPGTHGGKGEDWGIRRMADALDIPLGTVKSRVRAALQVLKKNLEKI